MASDIVVVGSCMIDFISYVPKLPRAGETVHGTKFATGFGGKGANQCVAAAKLGGNTSFIARVGNDSWGEKYLKNLKDEGVNTNFVLLTEGESSGIAQISVDESAENQIVIVAGANNKLCVKDVDAAAQTINNAKVLILQLETPPEIAIRAMKHCNKISILNGAPALKNADDSLLQAPTIFCVNESEASVFTNTPVNNKTDAKKVINILLDRGCKSVLLTLGAEGALCASQQERTPIEVKCPQVQAVDTTGAGDAFIGALAYMLANYSNLEMKKSIEVACHLASLSVQKPGTQISYPNQNDLKEILNKLDIIL